VGFRRLLACVRSTPNPEEASAGVEYTDLDTVLRESDFISIHCPLNEQTRGMIGAQQMALMKPTAYLINTARGPDCGRARLDHGAAGAQDCRRGTQRCLKRNPSRPAIRCWNWKTQSSRRT